MTEDNGMFYCPVCGRKQAVWQSDCDFEDYGIDGEGVVQFFVCAHCHTEIECFIPTGEAEEE